MGDDDDILLIISSDDEQDDQCDDDDDDDYNGFMLRLYASSKAPKHFGEKSQNVTAASQQGNTQTQSSRTDSKPRIKLKLPGITNCVNVLDSNSSDNSDMDLKIKQYSSSESEELFCDSEKPPKQFVAHQQVENDCNDGILKCHFGAEGKQKLSLRRNSSNKRNQLQPVVFKSSHLSSQRPSVAKKQTEKTAVQEIGSSDETLLVSPPKKRLPAKLKPVILWTSSDDDDFISCSQLTQFKSQRKKTSRVRCSTRTSLQQSSQTNKVPLIAHQSQDKSWTAGPTKNSSQVVCLSRNTSPRQNKSRWPHCSVENVKRKISDSRPLRRKGVKRLKLSESTKSARHDCDSQIAFSDDDSDVIYRPVRVASAGLAKNIDKIVSFSISDDSDITDGKESSEVEVACSKQTNVKHSGDGVSQMHTDITFAESDSLFSHDGSSDEVNEDSNGNESDSILSPKKQPAGWHANGVLSQATEDVSDSHSDSLLSPRKRSLGECHRIHFSSASRTVTSSKICDVRANMADELDCVMREGSDTTTAQNDIGQDGAHKPASEEEQNDGPSAGVVTASHRRLVMARHGQDDADTVSCHVDDDLDAESSGSLPSLDLSTAITSTPIKERRAEKDVAGHSSLPNQQHEAIVDASTCSYSQVDIDDDGFSDDDEVFASLLHSAFKPNDDKNDIFAGEEDDYEEWADDFIEKIDASFQEEYPNSQAFLTSEDDEDEVLIKACDMFELSQHHDERSEKRAHEDAESVADEAKPVAEAEPVREGGAVGDVCMSSAGEELQTAECEASKEEVVHTRPFEDEVVSAGENDGEQHDVVTSGGDAAAMKTRVDLKGAVSDTDAQTSEHCLIGDVNVPVREQHISSADEDHQQSEHTVTDDAVVLVEANQLPADNEGHDSRHPDVCNERTTLTRTCSVASVRMGSEIPERHKSAEKAHTSVVSDRNEHSRMPSGDLLTPSAPAQQPQQSADRSAPDRLASKTTSVGVLSPCAAPEKQEDDKSPPVPVSAESKNVLLPGGLSEADKARLSVKCEVMLRHTSLNSLKCTGGQHDGKTPATATDMRASLTDQDDILPEDPVPIDLPDLSDFGLSVVAKSKTSQRAEHVTLHDVKLRADQKVRKRDTLSRSPKKHKSLSPVKKNALTKHHTLLRSPIKQIAKHHSAVLKHRKDKVKSHVDSPCSLTCAIEKAKAEMKRRHRLLKSKHKTDSSSSASQKSVITKNSQGKPKMFADCLKNTAKSSSSNSADGEKSKKTVKSSLSSDSNQNKSKQANIYHQRKVKDTCPKDNKSEECTKRQPKSKVTSADKQLPRGKMIALAEAHHMKPRVDHIAKMRNSSSKHDDQCSKSIVPPKSKPSCVEQGKKSTDIYAVLNLKSPSPQRVVKPAELSKSTTAAAQPRPQQQQQVLAQKSEIMWPASANQNVLQQVSIQKLDSVQPTSTISTVSQPSFDSILAKMLKWSPLWFQEYEKINAMPPVVNKEELFPLLELYLTYDDYVKIITPHFLLETWHQVYSGWKKNTAQGNVLVHDMLPVHLQFHGIQGQESSLSPKFMDLSCQALLSSSDASRNNFTQEGDLVTLCVQFMNVKGAVTTAKLLGFVLRSSKMPRENGALHHIIEEQLRNKPKSTMILCTEIRLLYKKIRIDDKKFIKLEIIDSLVAQMRQHQALCYLPKSLLGPEILRPSKISLFTGPEVPESHNLLKQFNKLQAHAISMITAGLLLPYQTPKLYLLQGPPGTGKSHAIIGLIHRIIVKGVHQRPRVRILVCAPSNNTVDELVRRLKHVDQSLRQAKHGELRVVRVGKASSIQADVSDCSLDEIFNKQWHRYYSNRRQNTMDSVRLEAEHLQAKLDVCHKQREKLQQQGSAVEARAVESEMAKLQKRLNSINGGNNKSKLSAAEVYNIKREILMSAHVVCTTLNGSGSAQLMRYLRKTPAEMPFTSLIVDEAGQCTELDTLIPLQYGITKVVLVGDPEQLPPTVISKEAADQNYGQSLFERFYGYFKMRPDNPIIMLKTQYRMHSDVCSFPSKHVYMGRLTTDRAVHKALDKNYPFKHYGVFDLEYGQEHQSEDGAICNPAEVDFIKNLCHYLLEHHRKFNSHDIGIITPYQKQREAIQKRLQRDLPRLDVKTVDGFQGREKNIIILSCVRAGSASGNIGFLADRRRMNVALTRAKYACYVVGHVKSLQSNTDWGSLVKDAKERNVLLHIRTPSDISQALGWLHKQ